MAFRKENMKDFKFCKVIAKLAHDGQTYGLIQDYFDYHLMGVVDLVEQFIDSEYYSGRMADQILCVAVLHDVLEDTDVTPEDLSEVLSERNIESLKLLSKNYANKETYLEDISRDSFALIVKVFDSLFNRNQSANDMNSKRFLKYDNNIKVLLDERDGSCLCLQNLLKSFLKSIQQI